MEIVKKFDLEMAHIVRNAWSTRCSRSIHGHTYTIELVLERRTDAKELFDAGRMVIDFGLVKKYIGPFIDSFDHTTLLWDIEEDDFLEFFKEQFERVIICYESSSCEMMSAVIYVAVNKLLAEVENGDVVCTKVIVHETKTGRAECNYDSKWIQYVEDRDIVEKLWFSEGLMYEWPMDFARLAKRTGIGNAVDLKIPFESRDS
jgi:6-pyruvoyltetrahydropterin/6-carboxytetrahydropterin synthase